MLFLCYSLQNRNDQHQTPKRSESCCCVDVSRGYEALMSTPNLNGVFIVLETEKVDSRILDLFDDFCPPYSGIYETVSQIHYYIVALFINKVTKYLKYM